MMSASLCSGTGICDTGGVSFSLFVSLLEMVSCFGPRAMPCGDIITTGRG